MGKRYLAVFPGKRKPRTIGKHKLAIHIPTARFIYEFEGKAADARALIKAGRLLPRWREGMEVNKNAAEVLPEPERSVNGNGNGDENSNHSTPEERKAVLDAAWGIINKRKERQCKASKNSEK